MLSADSQLCFAVLLAAIQAICHAQADGSHKTLVLSHNHGFGNETRCSWNCTVILNSDLMEEMKTTIVTKRLIRAVVKYEKKVDDKCVNQTSHNSSGNATEHWQMWLSNNVSSFANIMETLSNLISGSSAEINEIRAVCTLQPSPTAATSHQKNTVASRGIPGGPNNRAIRRYINITESTGKYEFESIEGQAVVFSVLFIISSSVYYAPAFLCFFSPTVVKENGVRQIILEGASPVSFRSLMGNYFFSGDDGTIWHKARTFILLAVVLPALFLLPAIALNVKIYSWELMPDFLLSSFYLACYVSYACYVFQAIDLSFLTVKSFDGKTCMVCRRVQPEIYICRDQELPGQIIHHLRQQPLILLKCWRLFLRYLVNYCRMCLSVILPCKVSVSSCLGICLFPIFLLSIPQVALMLLTAMSSVACLGLLFTCPMSTICNVTRGRRPVYLKSCSSFLRYCCNPLSLIGVYIVLTFAAFAIANTAFWAITQLFSEDSLQYLACFVLVFYYVWSSYSSFTTKYQVLALTLYKHHKKSPVLTDQETERNTPIPGTVMRIPKELFDVACEQLMPIRVSVCILVLRVALILAFVFLVFSLPMWYHVSVTPVTGALVMFLSGLLPKIIDIFIGAGKKNIETIAIDEKVPYIIEDYNNSRATEQNIEIVIM